LEHITHLAHQFGGKVLDISTNNCIVEVSAKPNRIDSFMKLIAPFGILESARTGESLQPCVRTNIETNHANQHSIGLMALPRSPLHGPSDIEEKDAEDVVDQSTLPPG
jgi:acetolactate synthase-1/3 small subunit